MVEEARHCSSTSIVKRLEYERVLRRITEVESTETNVKHIPYGEGLPRTIDPKQVTALVESYNPIILYGGAKSFCLNKASISIHEQGIPVTYDLLGTAD